MLDRLDYDPEDRDGPTKARRDLDAALEVNTWSVPGVRRRTPTNPTRTPTWWRGDEDASQTFLHAMGVMT